VHERNYEKSYRHRSDKRSGKGLKDDMKICRTRCEDMKADKFIEKEELNFLISLV